MSRYRLLPIPAQQAVLREHLMDLVLFGVTVAVFSLTALVISLVVPRIGRAARRAQDSVGVMGAALERMLGAFRTIKASGAEHREGQRIHDAAREAWRADLRAAKWPGVHQGPGLPPAP